jgi:sRNA-binding carbon storage regulator CsrA
VKVGIKAPREVLVVAKEVKLVRDQNRVAATPASPAALSRLLQKFQAGSAQVPPDRTDE